jgi:hypothetical protein
MNESKPSKRQQIYVKQGCWHRRPCDEGDWQRWPSSPLVTPNDLVRVSRRGPKTSLDHKSHQLPPICFTRLRDGPQPIQLVASPIKTGSSHN